MCTYYTGTEIFRFIYICLTVILVFLSLLSVFDRPMDYAATRIAWAAIWPVAAAVWLYRALFGEKARLQRMEQRLKHEEEVLELKRQLKRRSEQLQDNQW